MSRSTPLDRYRNIGIVAHVDAGRTTTTERILFHTGLAGMQAANDGAALEGGITITSAATTCFWRDYRLNIIDTSAHSSVAGELERALRVLDGAVAVLDGAAGIEDPVQAVWRQADRFGLARLCFVNKMDRDGADFFRSVSSIADRLGAKPLVVQLPIGAGAGFIGVIDLVAKTALVWKDGAVDGAFQEIAIPAELAAQAAEYRAALVRTVLGDRAGEPSVEALKAAIRQGTLARAFVPVLCGSAFKNKGLQALLDAIVDYLPSPADMAGQVASDEAPFSAQIFRIVRDPAIGSVSFLRVYSGVIESGAPLQNEAGVNEAQVGRMIQIYANRREDVCEARTGDVVALVDLIGPGEGQTVKSDKFEPGAPAVAKTA